jgi:hypothetical protein
VWHHRRCKELMECPMPQELCGHSFSASSISAINKRLQSPDHHDSHSWQGMALQIKWFNAVMAAAW